MSELTDLEICKKIAEIEGSKDTLYSYSNHKVSKKLIAIFYDRTVFGYNPLTDKTLCFDLMVKHGVDFNLKTDGSGVFHNASWYIFNGVDDFDEFSLCDKNPQRAICLAIIKKHEVEL